MSYTFLLEAGEESSAESFSDMPASVLLRLNLTAEKSCSNASETESCQSSQFGTTCEPLMENRGAEKLTLCAVGSHAPTFQASHQSVATKTALTEKEAACGKSNRESLAKYDPATFSWRTHQCLLFEAQQELLEIWPQWAMWDEAECWELAPLALHIHEKGCGLYPTPRAADFKGASNKDAAGKARERGYSPNLPEFIAEMERGGQLNPQFSEWLMGWPIGWTDLKPLEMDKFQAWCDSHGIPFRKYEKPS